MAVLTITYERRNVNALDHQIIPGGAGAEIGFTLLQLGRGDLSAAGNALSAAVIPHSQQLQVFPGSGAACKPYALSIRHEQQLRRNENEKTE